MMPQTKWMEFVADRVAHGSASGESTAQQLLDVYKRSPDDLELRQDIHVFCARVLRLIMEARAKPTSRFEYMASVCTQVLEQAQGASDQLECLSGL